MTAPLRPSWRADLRHAFRLGRAARRMAAHAHRLPEPMRGAMPVWARALWRLMGAAHRPDKTGAQTGTASRIARDFQELGPSYIKLGQFLATRPDVIGAELARDLEYLQDRLPPFPTAQARAVIEAQTGRNLSALFCEFGEAHAAASIAQVHRAAVAEGGRRRAAAVKILRPGIEARFRRDLETFVWAAHKAERWHAEARRLRLIEAVQTLAHSVALEMDLRLEAAAIGEMAANAQSDQGFRVPKVDWTRTTRRVLTLDWIEGVALNDRAALTAAGHKPEELAGRLIRIFLTHALRDGFFHADMHPGNLFAAADGAIVAVDFGIMGRLDRATRHFLGEILHGFLVEDYRRIARIHIEAGYVPAQTSEHLFAQALRSIGEPIAGLPAEEISMGRLLAQLFEVTAQFDMPAQPHLLLLQKTMVAVEGLARRLHPGLNLWEEAAPALEAQIAPGLTGRAQWHEALETVRGLGQALRGLPELTRRAERLLREAEAAPRTGRTGEGPRRAGAGMVWGLIGLLAGAAGVWLWQAFFSGLP